MVSLIPDLITKQFRVLRNFLFPWKGVWKPKIPKRVALFFLVESCSRLDSHVG